MRWLSLLLVFASIAPQRSRAEVSEVRISRGYGILYLPLFVIEDQKLIEKHARLRGLGEVKVTWQVLDGGNVINDAMLAGALDIAAIGVPGFITLWAKAKGNPRLEVLGLSGLSATALSLNTVNPAVKTLRDFTPKDKIAVPGIKTSLSAVVLQMIVAREFGDAQYAKLDPITVGLGHPDAYAALSSGGKGGVNSHFGSPPFSILELDQPGIHRVVSSVEALGNITLDMVYALRAFHDRNPKSCGAVLAALDEAIGIIARDKKAAAGAYVRASKVKVSEEEVLRMLADPDTRFSATPDGVMKFATFMHRVGIISVAPKSWKDLFFPEIQDRPGS